MEFISLDRLDAHLWPQALELYHQAFPAEGRKPDRILMGMFEKKMSLLQVGVESGLVKAMAISGVLKKANVLLIDYMAVEESFRGQGIGRRFMEQIKRWAREERSLNGVIIEVEADPTPQNEERIRFWERCGFTLTEYVHHYIWVPEPYRAMYLEFEEGTSGFSRDGETLFRFISAFHGRAFRS
jgi:GNAT superfamily N-acetyltransferase